MITSVLIADRVEIAGRANRTARRFGIRTNAVFSDADADAKAVAGSRSPRVPWVADEALLLRLAPKN